MTGLSQRFPDEVFIPGQGSDLARSLLTLANHLGFGDQTVRVSEQGFMVPSLVASAMPATRDTSVDRRHLRKRDDSGRYIPRKGGS